MSVLYLLLITVPTVQSASLYGAKSKSLLCKVKVLTAEGSSYRYDSVPLIPMTKAESYLWLKRAIAKADERDT